MATFPDGRLEKLKSSNPVFIAHSYWTIEQIEHCGGVGVSVTTDSAAAHWDNKPDIDKALAGKDIVFVGDVAQDYFSATFKTAIHRSAIQTTDDVLHVLDDSYFETRVSIGSGAVDFDVHDRDSAIRAAETFKLAKVDLRSHASLLSKYGIYPTSATTYVASFKTYDVADMPTMDIKPPEFVIPGLLPVGLTVFAAPSKFGKSWACIDMCLAVSQGIPFWGFTTNRCEAIYFDLEGDINNLNKRLQALGCQYPDGIHVADRNIPDLDHGFLDGLLATLYKFPESKLIIIDTIGRIRGGSKRGEDAYQTDTRLYKGLQEFAKKHNVAILCITHTKKCVNLDAYDDPFAAMQGSAGVIGVADCTWMIAGKRDDGEKYFHLTGRSCEEMKATISFDQETKRWKLLGDTEQLNEARKQSEWQNNPIRRTLLLLLENQSYVVINKEDLFDAVSEKTNFLFNSPTELGKKLKAISSELRSIDNILVEDVGVRKGKRSFRISKR